LNLMRLNVTLIAALMLGACAAQFSVPPISASATGEHFPGKIIWHDLLTDTPAKTRTFYSELFGWEFRPLSDANINYTMIYQGDRMIGGMVDQNRLPNKKDISQWVVGLSVSDIESAAQHLTDGGGTVFTPPTSLGDRGTIAVVADPQGAILALLQTRDGDPVDNRDTPAQGEFLWDELWAADVNSATEFYSQLAPYVVEEETLGSEESPVDYRVLRSLDKPRVGIRANPVEGLMPMWVSYLRVNDAASLDSILERVESLGGRILVPATTRPSGGVVAVIAGPSGAGIALQTWAENQTIDQVMESGQ
jgi:predicted enzyme related to lactoylglutathione lyase